MNKVGKPRNDYDTVRTGRPSPKVLPYTSLETMNPGEVALASAVRRFRCGRPHVRSGRCCSCSRSCARLMLSPGAPTSVPAGTPSVSPTVVPALRVFAHRLIVVFVRRHALATHALRPHAFRPQCRCGCPRTRSAVRASAVSALALSPAAATGRHCRGGRARQG